MSEKVMLTQHICPKCESTNVEFQHRSWLARIDVFLDRIIPKVFYFFEDCSRKQMMADGDTFLCKNCNNIWEAHI